MPELIESLSGRPPQVSLGCAGVSQRGLVAVNSFPSTGCSSSTHRRGVDADLQGYGRIGGQDAVECGEEDGHRRCLVADTFELQCHLRPHIWVVASTRRDMQYGRLTVVQLVG